MPSRRTFLAQTAALTALAPPQPKSAVRAKPAERISLNGEWQFRIDSDDANTWRTVVVPHTWQIEAQLSEYRGVAWYRRTFETPADAAQAAVRIQFEAVFHSASVSVNGTVIGEHTKKGYTAFAFPVGELLRNGGLNVVEVRVDNAFNQHMLPRGRSSDWAHDGGIYRPVSLLITPTVFLERLDVDALPDLASGDAQLDITAYVTNRSGQTFQGLVGLRVIDDATGLAVANIFEAGSVSVEAGQTANLRLSANIAHAKLWHFDNPNLYRLQAILSSGHTFETTFGVRRFEVRDTAFYLNGERVRLMGVERMGGSNPKFGMAEPEEWIEHDHADLKYLNCVFTRVHWQQDRRVLDYCDRHGIMIQTEVPAWGPDTFKNMGAEPDADIMENGREQLREMIARDRNHPSICSWGLCNEIGGQNPPAYNFAQHMLQEAKRLDPKRLCSYASHSLRETPAKDVAGLMDFIECNEYFGSWQKGDADDLARSMDLIHAAFPNKPIVISEYGYCACTSDRPEGDEKRREVLRTQDLVLRQRDYIAGLIFFCYNDYRTHVGDRGLGVLQQRVHGVVDLFGAQKPSYELLRSESSPIESLAVEGYPNAFSLTIKTRQHVPAYILRGYTLRGVYYGYGEIPAEQQEILLPNLTPGQQQTFTMKFAATTPDKICFDVIRPTGFSSFTQIWKS